MARKKEKATAERIPKVRLARPGKRSYQLRYTDPVDNREVRISTGTHNEAEAHQQKTNLS